MVCPFVSKTKGRMVWLGVVRLCRKPGDTNADENTSIP
jgi:hypothetical protein